MTPCAWRSPESGRRCRRLWGRARGLRWGRSTPEPRWGSRCAWPRLWQGQKRRAQITAGSSRIWHEIRPVESKLGTRDRSEYVKSWKRHQRTILKGHTLASCFPLAVCCIFRQPFAPLFFINIAVDFSYRIQPWRSCWDVTWMTHWLTQCPGCGLLYQQHCSPTARPQVRSADPQL